MAINQFNAFTHQKMAPLNKFLAKRYLLFSFNDVYNIYIILLVLHLSNYYFNCKYNPKCIIVTHKKQMLKLIVT